MKVIHLASTSGVKIAALYYAIKKTSMDLMTVRGCYHEAKSGVSEQPFGRAEIHQGALNRLMEVKKLPCVSLETGIVKVGDVYKDITCCLIQTRFGLFEAWSQPVLIENHIINSWLELPNKSDITVGSIIAKTVVKKQNTVVECNADGVITHDDWYALMDHKTTRREILADCIAQAMKQWCIAQNAMPIPIIPAECVLFKDVSFLNIQDPLCDNPSQLMETAMRLADNLLFNKVVALDARGFLPVAGFAINGYPVIMARKKGKLPVKELTESCTKEYADTPDNNTLSISEGVIKKGDRVIILDDVLATGGSVEAVERLVKRAGGEVIAFITLYAIANEETGELLCDPVIIPRVRFLCTQLEIKNKKTFEFNEMADINCLPNVVAISPPSLKPITAEMTQIPVHWGKFCYSSNLWIQKNSLLNRRVFIFLNTMIPSEMLDVLQILTILYRKRPKEITVVIPFFEQGTQDRIENHNNMESIAQIDTISKLIGNNRIVTFDLHAEQSRMNPAYNLEYYSLVEELWDRYSKETPDVIVVFPDDGAHKRFGKMPNINKAITFRKKRDGNKRIVATDDHITEHADYVIIDDMVRSGGTMKAVAQYLIDNGASTVDALFAHAPFERKTGDNMTLFNNIWTSDSCPRQVPSAWIKVRVIDLLKKYEFNQE